MRFDGVGLRKDVDKYYKSLATSFVETAVDLLEKEARNCVMYFYNDYTPSRYQRTYNFLDDGVESNISKREYKGEVTLLNNVDEGNYIYSDEFRTDIQIRKESWIGIHGMADHVTDPSPLRYLMDFYNSSNFRNTSIEKAKKIASSAFNNYKYLKK